MESTRVLEIGAASVDAPHKRDPRREMSDEAKLFAHAARQVVAWGWCKSSLLSSVHSNHSAACRRA